MVCSLRSHVAVYLQVCLSLYSANYNAHGIMMTLTNGTKASIFLTAGTVACILYLSIAHLLQKHQYNHLHILEITTNASVQSRFQIDIITGTTGLPMEERFLQQFASEDFILTKYINNFCYSTGSSKLKQRKIEDGIILINELLKYLRSTILLDFTKRDNFNFDNKTASNLNNQILGLDDTEQTLNSSKKFDNYAPRVPRIFIDKEFRNDNLHHNELQNIYGLRLLISRDFENRGSALESIPYRIPAFYSFTMSKSCCEHWKRQRKHRHPCNGSVTNLRESFTDKSDGYFRIDGALFRQHVTMYVFRDAVVQPQLGTVITASYAYVTTQCQQNKISPDVDNAFITREKFKHLNEVFVTTQFWSYGVFHFMAEAGPRIAPYLDFLKQHPGIKIHAPDTSITKKVFQLYGLDYGRVVSNWVWADVVYLPQGGGCGCASNCVTCLQIMADVSKSFKYQTPSIEVMAQLQLTAGCNNKRAKHYSKFSNITNQTSVSVISRVDTAKTDSASGSSAFNTKLKVTYDQNRSSEVQSGPLKSRSISIREGSAKPDRLVLIKRTRRRYLENHCDVEVLLQKLAEEFRLIYILYPDQPLPDLNTTVDIFRRAAVVVAPHGAGLANLIFAPSGTFVVEVLVKEDVNLCYQAMSYQLGHRWHGLISLTAAPQLSVDMTELGQALRIYLESRLQILD